METTIVGSEGKPEDDATCEEEIECEGESCDHVKFKKSDKGCNPIARLCPTCVSILERSFSGASVSQKGVVAVAGASLTSSEENVAADVPIDDQRVHVVVPATPTQSKAVEHRYLQLRGAFRVMLTLPQDQWSTIKIGGRNVDYCVDNSSHVGVSSMPRTHYFRARDRVHEELYWFEQHAAITTPSHAYIEFCGLSNGDECLGVWETRCNRPFHALLINQKQKGKCELFTAHNFRIIFPGVVFDTSIEVDFDKMQSIKMEWLIKTRRIFDIERGLHRNCRHPEVSDPRPDDGSDKDDLGDYSESDRDSSDDDEHGGDGPGNIAGDEQTKKNQPNEGSEGEEATKDEDNAQSEASAAVKATKAASRAISKAVRVKKRKAAAAQLTSASGLGSSSRKKHAVERFSPGEKSVRSRIGLGPPCHRSMAANKGDASLSREYVESMTVPDIRAALRDRQAQVSGRKADIVERLLELLATEREGRNKKNHVTASTSGPSGRTKLDMEGEPVSDKGDDLKTLICAMMKQQEMMIELMHSKGLGEHIDGPPGISAKKPHPPSSPPQRDTSSEALGKDMAERFHKIQPRPSHSSTYVGDHDMEAFFRHNLEMAKLIQENAELRKDRLVGDMIRGVHE